MLAFIFYFFEKIFSINFFWFVIKAVFFWEKWVLSRYHHCNSVVFTIPYWIFCFYVSLQRFLLKQKKSLKKRSTKIVYASLVARLFVLLDWSSINRFFISFDVHPFLSSQFLIFNLFFLFYPLFLGFLNLSTVGWQKTFRETSWCISLWPWTWYYVQKGRRNSIQGLNFFSLSF